jgi:type I restriction enzyme S subunit
MVRDANMTTIGDFLQLEGGEIKTGPFGTRLKAAEYSANGVPVISVGEIEVGRIVIHEKTPRVGEDVTARMPEYLLRTGDIVFARKGAVDRSALVTAEQEGWFLGSDGIRLRLPAACNARFIAYQLRSVGTQAWLLQHSTGTTMPSLNQGTIERIPILLPPRSFQDRIAHVLGTLDDKIELSRRMNETLEAMAQTLFKSWFVDFDPVRTKAMGCRPPGLEVATAALFPDTFDDSPLGSIPKGWRLQSLGDYIELQRGKTYQSKLKGLPGPFLLGLAAIERNGGFRDDKLETYGGDSPDNLLVRPGELFVSLKDVTQSADLLGAVACVPQHISLGRLTQDTVKLIFKPGAISRHFLFRTMLLQRYRDYCRSHATGTTNLGLSRMDFLGYQIAVPPMQLQESLDRQLDPLELRAASSLVENVHLAKLRDCLLPKLLSGEVKVPDHEPIE